MSNSLLQGLKMTFNARSVAMILPLPFELMVEGDKFRNIFNQLDDTLVRQMRRDHLGMLIQRPHATVGFVQPHSFHSNSDWSVL